MKTAVVTGSTKGIGKAIVRSLLEEGYFVVANYARDAKSALEMAEEFAQYKDRLKIIQAELSSYEATAIFVSSIKEITEKIDVIILNCGATDRSSFNEIRKEDWEYVINTNINVPFYILQMMDEMISDDGSIVFIGSHMAIYPHGLSLSYGVTKAAVHQMARELVKVYAGRGRITVNAIAPGFIDTPRQAKKTLEHRKSIENKIACHRFGRAEEVAELVMTVIHDKYMNGSVIEIHGGYSYQ
jgi:3-oxoacyl-[acyl-carrier protein] reductase